MRKRNRQNSVKSDCINGEPVGMLIRRTNSDHDDQNGIAPFVLRTGC